MTMTAPDVAPQTQVRRGEPVSRLHGIISPEVAEMLAQLDLETERRTEALAEAERASAAARVIVVALLRAGYPRKELVDRPFSSAWLTRIQAEEGLSKPRTRKS
jgi:hypothetical protein